jgi:exodeoxyribonuclease III
VIDQRLVDLSRKFQPDDDRLYTWWAPWRNHRERNIGWRLDYVLAHEALAARAVSCTVSPGFGSSDHGPVTALFDVEPPRLPPDPDAPSTPPAAPKGQLELF